VSPEGITTDPAKQKVVHEWQIPCNKHEIRSFFDLYAYYRRFISGFTNIAELLTKPTEKKEAYQQSS
jgi:hypothetical protein